MPTGTYNPSGTQTLARNVISLGCSCESGAYPTNVTISFAGGSGYFYLNTGMGDVSYSFAVWVCDSGGGNAYQIGTISLRGVSTTSATISGNITGTGLTGKALYCKVTGSEYLDYLYIRGSGAVSVTTTTTPGPEPPEPTPTYSASTFTAANVNFGSSSTVTISNANISALRHKITWAVGSHSHESSYTSVGAKTASYTIPTSWMDAAPSSTSATLTITLKTYNGSTQVGNNYVKTYKANVPSSVVPTLGSISVAIYNASSAVPNKYIQGVTGARITFNNASPGSGASGISTYTLKCSASETMTRSGNVFTISTLKNSGSLKFTATVTDSRGRKSTAVTKTITVVAYSKPTISSATAFRCNSEGVQDESGTYLSISCVTNYTNISGNSLVTNSQYYKTTSSSTKYTAKNNMKSGVVYIVGNGNIEPESGYSVSFETSDTIGNSAKLIVNVQTTPYSIHVKNGGNGVAFGKTSERSNAVELAPTWGLYYKGYEIGVPILVRPSAASHTFTVKSSSRQLVICTMGGVSRTWIGYVYCNSSGTTAVAPLHAGTNIVQTNTTNEITFTPDTEASCYVRCITVQGGPLS